MASFPFGGGNRQGGRGISGRLIIAIGIALISLFSFFSHSTFNPITGEKQHIGDITPDQEIALGLEATPEMTNQYGGEHPDASLRRRIDQIGQRIVQRSAVRDSPYKFDFHLLRDPDTINAFALPGGQVFMTYGLMRRLSTDGQIAGVLGHEVGHVVGRHGAEHIAKGKLTNGLVGAAVLASYDPNNPRTRNSAAVAAMVGQLVNLHYGRDDELEADRLGVRFMTESGYDPRSMIDVMKVLQQASKSRTPEFLSTHPNPENRMDRIEAAIQKEYPDGVPEGLER